MSMRKHTFACAVVIWTLVSAVSATAETITVQVKSYISSVNLLDPNQFAPGSRSCQAAMAAVVNCGTLNENPVDGMKASGDYRLWSEVKIEVDCKGANVSSWNIKPVDRAFGSEFAVFATKGDLSKPLTAKPAKQGNSAIDKVTFQYRLRGQPHTAGIEAMNAVKHRTCSYIWHEVNGSLTCSAGRPIVTADLNGSAFPSHRLWLAGKKEKEMAQGPFKNLWVCDSSDPSSVK